MKRIKNHPILGKEEDRKEVKIIVDGKEMKARAGDTIAAALTAQGYRRFRLTEKNNSPRGVFCGIGQCTDCSMTVNGVPNVRTCITEVKDGMVIKTQQGSGEERDYLDRD